MIDPKFKKYPIRFFAQAFLGGLLIAICISMFDSLFGDQLKQHTIRTYIVGSIAASTFLVFGAPHLGSSKPGKIFFGHSISALIGVFFSFVIHQLISPTNTGFGIFLAALFSISFAIFAMTLLNYEHPPAAGTALAIATHNAPYQETANFITFSIPSILIVALFVIIVAAILSIIRLFFYFDDDNIKSIEGLGEKVKAVLDDKGINSISDLYKHDRDVEKTFKKILSAGKLYNNYCKKSEIKSIAARWASQAKEINDKNIEKEWRYHYRLRDLF